MKLEEQINNYIKSQPEPKAADLQALHLSMLKILPTGKLWFLDGTDENGKVVSNPNIGYGSYTIKYADATQKEFYQIGLSANTGGISVYIMGLKDKNYLVQNYADKIGKAKVTGYCIKFKALKDIHLELLEEAIRNGV